MLTNRFRYDTVEVEYRLKVEHAKIINNERQNKRVHTSQNLTFQYNIHISLSKTFDNMKTQALVILVDVTYPPKFDPQCLSDENFYSSLKNTSQPP